MPRYAFFEVDRKLYRRSFRFPLETPVSVLRGGARCAHGSTINISRDGAAVKVLPLLALNTDYEFFIHGIGRLSGTVMRKFDAYSFGVEFNISEEAKRRLDQVFADLVSAADGDGALSEPATAPEKFKP